MKTSAIPLLGLVLASVVRAQAQSVVREDRVVRVDAITEHWLLVWREAPAPACGPEDPGWSTCPCQGFAFGEMGKLDLVRRRPRHADERLPLDSAFSYGEFPSYNGARAALQRWPILNTDDESDHSTGFARQVRQRASVQAIHVGDYDHDGRRTEFPLLIASGPCGHDGAIIVGLSRTQPTLHAFTSTAHPERPLILDSHIWDELLHSRGAVTSVEMNCGDHGSDEETDVRIVASTHGIDATRLTYACRSNDSRGVLKSTEAF